MSLNWNITACADMDVLLTEDEWTMTDTLIWMTMLVGMNSITEDNAAEFFARCQMFERLQGKPMVFAFVDNKKVDYYITPQDVTRRIGLRTNASPLTFAKFLTNAARVAHDEGKKEYARTTLVTA